MNDQRLYTIYLEAGRLFNTKGYAETKMAEIARASGIAVGTMYSLFTGKEAVLSFVIQATLDKEYFLNDITFPIKQADVAVLLKQLRCVIASADSVLNITDKNGNIIKDFPTLMEDVYDFFTDYLIAFDNIERNAGILEELSQEYLPQKSLFFENMGACMKRYKDVGHVWPFEYNLSHVVFLIDTLTWWALNARLSFPEIPIDQSTAKETCMAILRRAYMT